MEQGLEQRLEQATDFGFSEMESVRKVSTRVTSTCSRRITVAPLLRLDHEGPKKSGRAGSVTCLRVEPTEYLI